MPSRPLHRRRPPPPPPPPPAAPGSDAFYTTNVTAIPPAPTLPALTLAEAKRYVRQTLAGALGQRFKPAHSYSATGGRKSPIRFTYGIRFWHGPSNYYGAVTVYLVSGPNRLTEWTNKYTVRWISRICLNHSPDPGQCPIYTKRGTW
jgi:hypothetical protein